MRRRGHLETEFLHVSKVLKGGELRYSNIKKVVLVLLLAIQKFKVYLENHQGMVIRDQNLRQILQILKMFGQMLAWLVEMGPYCLQYKLRSSKA